MRHILSFYCKVCIVLPVEVINNAIEEARGKIVSNKISDSDMKSRAKILKVVIQERSLNLGIDLKVMN
jgi:diacylglycerol kinase